MEKNMCKLTLYSIHPETKIHIHKNFAVHKDKSLHEATLEAHKLLKYDEIVPVEQCRLVKYHNCSELMEQSFDGQENSPFSVVIGGVQEFYCFDLFMEVRGKDEQFKVYKPGEIFDPVSIAAKAVSPSDKLCYGYQNTDTGGCYITTCKLEIGLVNREKFHEDDQTLLHIASYDDAETRGAYIGQINMIEVSSYSGPKAVVWGYDVAVHDDLRKKKLFSVPENKDDLLKDNFSLDTPGKIPVYDIQPLLDATESLYGTVSKRHFPILPGAHVPCAVKEGFSEVQDKPKSGWIWGFLSLAIAEDRSKDACLFVEDKGFFPDGDPKYDTKEKVIKELNKKRQRVVYSQLLCGENQLAPYKEIFIGYRHEYVDGKSYGCALTCAPYVTLARNALPGGSAKNLMTSLKAWEKAVL